MRFPKDDCPLASALPCYLTRFDLSCLASLDSHTGKVGIMDPINHKRKWPGVGVSQDWALSAEEVGAGAQSGITLSCRRNISLQKKRSEPGSISLNINYSDAFCHASSESSGHSQTLPHRSSSQRYWVRSRQEGLWSLRRRSMTNIRLFYIQVANCPSRFFSVFLI